VTIFTAVYTANRGYAWSNIPPGMTNERLANFLRLINSARGDFPDPLSMTIGFVSDGKTAAIFTIQNVEKWDAEQRSADYGAFAFFENRDAGKVDLVEMLNRDFFWMPSKSPITELEYLGASSATMPIADILKLNAVGSNQLNPHAIGDLLAKTCERCSSLIGILNNEIMTVKCGGANK